MTSCDGLKVEVPPHCAVCRSEKCRTCVDQLTRARPDAHRPSCRDSYTVSLLFLASRCSLRWTHEVWGKSMIRVELEPFLFWFRPMHGWWMTSPEWLLLELWVLIICQANVPNSDTTSFPLLHLPHPLFPSSAASTVYTRSFIVIFHVANNVYTIHNEFLDTLSPPKFRCSVHSSRVLFVCIKVSRSGTHSTLWTSLLDTSS